MNKIKVDIIIPAYNAHKTIVRTLSSIAVQKINFPLTVTIVNDASKKDYSEEIKLFENRLNINVINLPENVGVGVARQVALEKTSGDYIIFIYSDDVFYDCISLQKLYSLTEDGKNDYGFGGLAVEENNTINFYQYHEECLHSKIFSRKLIKKNNIKFNSTRTSEDNSFNHICLSYAQSITKTADPCYIYINNKESLTKGISDTKVASNMIDYIDNLIYTYFNVKDRYSDILINFYSNALLYVWDEYKKIDSKNKNLGKKVFNKLMLFIEQTDDFNEEVLKENLYAFNTKEYIKNLKNV